MADMNHALTTAAVAAPLMLSIAASAAAQTPLNPNRTTNGELTAADAPMPYGAGRMDCYVFNVPAGRYRINLESSAFHPFVIAGPGRSCAGDLERGSFGSDGRSAEIRVNVVSGPWFVRVAAKEYGLGAYRVRLTSADQSAPVPTAPARQPPVVATPPGLELSRNMACGYRPGSGQLTALRTYRNADMTRSDYVQHEGRAVTWASLGFVEARWRPWYTDNEPITFRGRQYRKYGLPRLLSPSEVRVGGEYDGLAVLVDPMSDQHEVVYLLVTGQECEFQPYQRD